MHSTFKLLSAAGLVIAALLATSPAFASAPDKDAKSPTAAARPQKPAPVLEKGMTEAQIIAAIGRPGEIKPMKLPAGNTHKAETWVYRRNLGTHQIQVATGTRSVPSFNGMGVGNDATGATQEVIYTLKQVTTYSVTSLLMIDGKLELARQTTEQEERF